MISISFSSSFKRAFKRRVKGNVEREERFWRKLEVFQKTPFDPTLRTHKLSGRLKDLWSFTVEYDLRIVFYFADEDKAVFIDLGTHDEVY
jgi:addiction module RelE/StbE family toxin